MYQQQQYGQYQQYPAPPAPHYGDDQNYQPPPQQQYYPPPQQYQQGWQNDNAHGGGGYYQPPQQNHQHQHNPHDDYDPTRPTPPQHQESHLFCHLPRPFGVWNKYILPYEETLIVQNPCDFRRDEITIKNSRHEPIFKTAGLHKAHEKDYPLREGKPECVIRSTTGEDLMIIRHDPDKKLTNYFSVEDAKDGSIIAWLAAGEGAGLHETRYNIFVFNRLSRPKDFKDGDENIVKIRVEGDFQDDKVDFKFEGTDNRFAMLRRNFEQSGGPTLPNGATGTKVAMGFDVAVVAALMIVVDMHDWEYHDEEEKGERNKKFAGKMGRAIGKGLVNGLFGGGGN